MTTDPTFPAYTNARAIEAHLLDAHREDVSLIPREDRSLEDVRRYHAEAHAARRYLFPHHHDPVDLPLLQPYACPAGPGHCVSCTGETLLRLETVTVTRYTCDDCGAETGRDVEHLTYHRNPFALFPRLPDGTYLAPYADGDLGPNLAHL